MANIAEVAPELYSRMKMAVAERTPGRLVEFERTAQDYPGSIPLLSKWLEHAGHDNPYLACQSMTLAPTSRFSVKNGGRQALGVSASGHKLYRQHIMFVPNHNTTNTFAGGSELFMNIIQSFGTLEQQDRFSDEGREKNQRRKRSNAELAMESLPSTLDELVTSAQDLQGPRSELLRQRAEAILKMDEEIRSRLVELDRLTSGSASALGNPTYFVEADKGGQLFGWLKRNYKSLPAGIQEIFDMFNNSLVDMEDERLYMGALIAYEAANRFVKKEAALGTFLDDLALVEQLAQDSPQHPVIQEYGEPDLSRVRGLLEQEELTRVDAVRVLQAYPIDRVRLDVNSRYLERVAGFGDALDSMRHLFMVGEQWRDDSMGGSVPMGRLKATAYNSALTYHEFRAVRDALRYSTLARGRDNMLKAVSIRDFRELAAKVVLAGRKHSHLSDVLSEKGLCLADEDIREKLEGVELFRGKDFALAEDFEDVYGISLQDFLARGEDAAKQSGHHAFSWRKIGSSLRTPASYGIWNKAVDVEWFANAASRMTPREELAELIEKAAYVKHHPLVLNPEQVKIPDAEFLLETRKQEVERWAGAASRLGELPEDVMQRRELWQSIPLYGGHVGSFISVHKNDYSRMEPRSRHQDIEFVVAEELAGFLDRLDNDYVPLSAEWREKAVYLSSARAKDVMRRVGKTHMFHDNYALRGMPENAYVHRVLVESVDALEHQIQETLGYCPEVLDGDVHLSRSYAVKAVGTTMRDKGRFKPAFPNFRWRKRFWEAPPVSGAQAMELSSRVAAYNREHGAEVRLKLTTLE